MQIVLVLLVIGAAVLLTLGAVVVGSLVVGGVLVFTKRAQVLVPVCFLVVPATVLGSLAGGVIIGHIAIRSNQTLVFLGPLGGLILGGIVGLFLGLAGGLFWWRRIARAA